MKKARAIGAWGISVVVGAGMLWACSSSTTESGTPGGGINEDATTGSDSSSSYSSGDGSTPITTDSGIITKKDSGPDASAGACGSSATSAACYQCCDSLSDGGVQDFFNLQLTCICDTKKCGTATKGCKNTLCANPDTDDAGLKCDECQDKIFADDAGDAGCVDPVNNDCAADPSCLQGITCVVESNCDSLP